MGTHPRGGLLALVGDDPAAKSSSASTRGCRCAATVPGASEFLPADLGMPTLYAADPKVSAALGTATASSRLA
jgi:indolepyruvate ferredoxin oxidoreductase